MHVLDFFSSKTVLLYFEVKKLLICDAAHLKRGLCDCGFFNKNENIYDNNKKF